MVAGGSKEKKSMRGVSKGVCATRNGAKAVWAKVLTYYIRAAFQKWDRHVGTGA